MNSTVYSFEDGVPTMFSVIGAGRTYVTDRHFMDGSLSLAWEYRAGSKLSIKGRIGFAPFVDNRVNQARSTFAVWVYNERSSKGGLVFQFGRGERVDCQFEFKLAFQGWRTAWLTFERDMEGTPHHEMDTLTIVAPIDEEGGTVYFDQMVMSTPVDPRHPTRDEQVPVVNVRADRGANNHWLSLYRYSRLESMDRSVAEATREETEFISSKYEEYLLTDEGSPLPRVDRGEPDLIQLARQFSAFRIVRKDGLISGRPVHLVHLADIYPSERRHELLTLTDAVNVKTYTELMFKIALAYRQVKVETEREKLLQMFADALEHMLDQGWAYGSSLGTVHHLGYNLLCWYPAVFIMKDILAHRHGSLLKRTQQAMYWFSGAGRIYMDTAEIEGNIDIFNTTITGMLASLLLMDDPKERGVALSEFSRWLSQCLRPAPGLRAALKIDGSVYHHANHYPAYGVGGFNGVAPIVYFLSGTRFRIASDAHRTLNKALLAMRLYSNKYEWLISLSARHPTGTWALSLPPYKYMALAGRPEEDSGLDYEMAAAYLRLLTPGQDEEFRRRLLECGVRPEKDPEGHWAMNYAALTLHRRDNWLAGVRGHSRYLWANETYSDCNLYGRYITHGHLQIMSQGDPVTNADSGYVPDGWDWNRWPGTTTVRLPIDQLLSDVRNVDTWSGYEEMLLSDETFAGGLSLEERNGMFAMKLHEHPKYEGTHRARKSFFFFDNRIIALGSDIENENEHLTETTLFQCHLPTRDEPIWHSLKPLHGAEEAIAIRQFPYSNVSETKAGAWMMDNKGNGYYVAGGQTVGVSRGKQISRHQKNRSVTEGDFAAAWLQHGVAPKEAEYEYAIVVKTNPTQMSEFAARMSVPAKAAYKVIQKNYDAHIVKDNETQTTGYALFEAERETADELLVCTDTPCMAMIRELSGNAGLVVSAVDPDLRLYSGVEADQYDENGVRREVSVYSRAWVHAESQPHRLTITLRGSWTAAEPATRVKVLNGDDRTILQFECRDGLPMEIRLDSAANGCL
ncbi:chondroitinase family polysaccharide lyase [Paenibacillus silviterrae]|uniref:chondroitinase family polysaccharide lyase n=1 Tax=Paenibacillus silviterrae TaxID=3242194 RepID=UPI002543E895|nr:chondroitinase family polysaccharide lyase [Paenibacillus chinjuensis]